MVNLATFTATEYGDYLIASLQEPYTNTLRIIDWEVVAGLKTPTMTGTVNCVGGTSEIDGIGTQFDASFAIGDKIIIGNQTYTIQSIPSSLEIIVEETFPADLNSVQYYREPDNDSYFEYEYRWSQTGDVFSQFELLDITSQTPMPIPGASSGFDTTKPVWIDLKAEVASIVPNNSLTFISVTYTIETVDGVIESCPNFCTDCSDPFAMNGCANITVSCNENLFNPYNLTKSVNIYKQLTGMVSNIFGHEVNYFRTEPDLRTSDVILMEYSLHNVVARETVKILVPDNEFPTEANTYDIFGIDLADFEIHITAEEYERAFGFGKIPRNKDYMFIPIINRMYEVSSVSLADEFNKSYSYWRVKLVKYQERTSVMKDKFDGNSGQTFDEATDVLTTGIEEIFGEEIQKEYDKNRKPEQFQTIISTYQDGIREFVSKDLGIVDYDLKNRWTIVSKNYYDMGNIDLNEKVLSYQAPSKLEPGKNAAYTGWFSPKSALTPGTNYYLFGDNDALMTSFRLELSDTEFKIRYNGMVETFNHGVTFNPGSWYGYVININNSFLQVGVAIYELDPNSNTSIVPAAMNLDPVFNENRQMANNVTWASDSNYGLRSNGMNMTNIRVFNTPIEFEQHSNVLNQYVVRDNQLAIIIDNAIPSLGYQKFASAR